MGVFNLFRNNKKKKENSGNQASSKFIDDEWLEVSANSKKEAIERACVALNTVESHLEIKPIGNGKKFRARKVEKAQASQAETTEAGAPKAEKKSKIEPEQTTDETSPVRHQENTDSDEDDWENEEEIAEETEVGKAAQETLQQIITHVEANATVEVFETNKTIRMEIKSEESGLFIGKFGQTLDSIQHVLKKILEKKHEHDKHVVIDAENYRLRREESLETKARKMAKKARQEKRSVSIEPMNAMDRRIVHMALKGEPGIETKSVGEGSSRRVLIVPKKKGGGRGNGRSRNGHQTRGRGGNRRGGNQRKQPSRLHDSYDVPAHSKSQVFGDNPEEYFEGIDDQNNGNK